MPTLHYVPLRGRAEPVRIALAAAGVEYVEVAVDYSAVKAQAGTAACPFGQFPMYEDGDLLLPQMDAILRYIARKYDLYGSGEVEAAHVDAVLVGVEDVRRKYLDLVYQKQLEEEAKQAYQELHISKASMHTRNGGAHFGYLSGYLERNNGGAGFVIGNKLSIADIQLFEIVDLHLREAAFPAALSSEWPLLKAHHDRMAALPGIAEYLVSPRRPTKINGNNMG